MKFKVKNRFSGSVQFTAEIECAEDASVSIKLGLAVKWAIKTRANLADAYLADAYLAGANLADANLAGANLADAYLAGANLADANLEGANLADANLAGANLADANLADANLADAYLAGANLAGANLAGANLAGANLAGANLAGANLADANLAGANLADANLEGANLADANLAGANLADAYLADAYLADANLAGAYLADANHVPEGVTQTDPPEPYDSGVSASERRAARAAAFRERNPNIPVIPDIDAQILKALESGAGKLDMGSWHSCETTHCRAGWAVHLAGEAGYALERQTSAENAGRMIYIASTGRVPHFYATDADALDDIRKCAAEQIAAQESAQSSPTPSSS